MSTKIYKVVGVAHGHGEEQQNDDGIKFEIQAKMEDKKEKGFEEYVKKFGHHFNDKFGHYVVNSFVSVNPKISYARVEEMLKASDDNMPKENTIGDLYVKVNEIKATHSAMTVKSDIHALSLAIECLNSPNHEDGDIFCDWVDILHRRGKKIPWTDFV